MQHARQDYNRIQDPTGLIPDDEPVFLLRAQDKAAPAIVEEWANRAEYEGASPEIVQAAREHANTMRAYQAMRGCKTPDMPTPLPGRPYMPPKPPVKPVA